MSVPQYVDIIGVLSHPIYLDAHATTPVDPRVLEAMLPFFTEHFGNAASRNHSFGWTAGKAVERAREQIAALIGARFRDVVFTSGATESNNLAIKGLAARAPADRRHIVTVVTEHRAVLDPCRSLERSGFRVTYLGVDRHGRIDLDRLRSEMTSTTLLVSAMSANNEIGVLHPVADIAAIAHEHGALFHCDAAQSPASVPLDAAGAGIDLVSLSAHKLYGPKGSRRAICGKTAAPVRSRTAHRRRWTRARVPFRHAERSRDRRLWQGC